MGIDRCLLIIVAIFQEDLFEFVSIIGVIFREFQEEILFELFILIRRVKKLPKSAQVEVHVGVKVQNVSQWLHACVECINQKPICGQKIYMH